MAMGGAFFRFWRGMIFFPPTSHLVCLFRPNKRETERHRSSADDRDGSGVGQCACTHTHTHTHTNTQDKGNRWKGPQYAAGAGARPGGQAPPLASLGVHWYPVFRQTLKKRVESRKCDSTLPGKLVSCWELLHDCISLVDDKWSYHPFPKRTHKKKIHFEIQEFISQYCWNGVRFI